MRFKKLKLWCCFRMGWHSYANDFVSFDGCSVHAQCRNCKGIGLIDSQGNLFGCTYDHLKQEITP